MTVRNRLSGVYMDANAQPAENKTKKWGAYQTKINSKIKRKAM